MASHRLVEDVFLDGTTTVYWQKLQKDDTDHQLEAAQFEHTMLGRTDPRYFLWDYEDLEWPEGLRYAPKTNIDINNDWDTTTSVVWPVIPIGGGNNFRPNAIVTNPPSQNDTFTSDRLAFSVDNAIRSDSIILSPSWTQDLTDWYYPDPEAFMFYWLASGSSIPRVRALSPQQPVWPECVPFPGVRMINVGYEEDAFSSSGPIGAGTNGRLFSAGVRQVFRTAADGSLDILERMPDFLATAQMTGSLSFFYPSYFGLPPEVPVSAAARFAVNIGTLDPGTASVQLSLTQRRRNNPDTTDILGSAALTETYSDSQTSKLSVFNDTTIPTGTLYSDTYEFRYATQILNTGFGNAASIRRDDRFWHKIPCSVADGFWAPSHSWGQPMVGWRRNIGTIPATPA